MIKRFQFVWWWDRFSRPRFFSWANRHDANMFFDYSLIFGPLEIRVWKKGVLERIYAASSEGEKK